jgi:hypothetical protein
MIRLPKPGFDSCQTPFSKKKRLSISRSGTSVSPLFFFGFANHTLRVQPHWPM